MSVRRSGLASIAHVADARQGTLATAMAEPLDFLAELHDDELAELRDVATTRRHARGTALFHEGDDAGAVLVILEGRVKATRSSADGKEILLALSGPGEIVGELAAIDGAPRAATVTVVDDLEALVVPGSAFRAWMDRHPRMATVMWRIAAARLRSADGDRLDFAAHDVTGRVARRLVELAPDTAGDGGEITVEMTQDELASWAAASREAVSRALLTLRELGWVQTRRGRIVIEDLDALRRYAAGPV